MGTHANFGLLEYICLASRRQLEKQMRGECMDVSNIMITLLTKYGITSGWEHNYQHRSIEAVSRDLAGGEKNSIQLSQYPE